MGSTKRERQKQGRQARLEAARAAQQRAKRLRTARNVAILIVILVGVVWFASRQLGDDNGENVSAEGTSTTTPTESSTTTTESSTPTSTITGETPCPPAGGSDVRVVSFAQPPPTCIDPAQQHTAVFETSEGTVRVALDTEVTPATTNNFVVLARYHFYDGTELFRTDPSIGIIQGGAPTNTASDLGPGYTIPDEGGEFDFSDPNAPRGPFTYAPGDLVMARSGGPNASGAQFFFCVNDACSNLDAQGTYLKFGHVTEGLDVLEAILALHEPDQTGQVLGGSPSRPVTVESVTIEEAPASS